MAPGSHFLPSTGHTHTQRSETPVALPTAYARASEGCLFLAFKTRLKSIFSWWRGRPRLRRGRGAGVGGGVGESEGKRFLVRAERGESGSAAATGRSCLSSAPSSRPASPSSSRPPCQAGRCKQPEQRRRAEQRGVGSGGSRASVLSFIPLGAFIAAPTSSASRRDPGRAPGRR